MKRSMRWTVMGIGCAALLGAGLSVVSVGCETQWASQGLIDQPAQGNGRAVPASVGRGPVSPSPIPTHPADELWVIARYDVDDRAAPAAEDDGPGSGALLGMLPGPKDAEPKRIPIPLKHTEVRGSIAAYIATVDVTQQFENPYDEKIEAVYVFPLPQNAAVSEFVMTIGERRIRGIIRERKEAERIYQQARAQGHVASLLTQERPNIFTQKVANIEPGKRIDVNIRYFNTLAYHDGWYEFVFPMVVGPRFNPPGIADGVGAVARERNGASGQDTEVQYLRPNERSGHDIALSVDIDAGVRIEELTCKSHEFTRTDTDAERVTIALDEDDRIPNRDFVMRYRVAGKKIKTNLLTHRDERGGYFTLMLYPPADLKSLSRRPMEMIFVLDCSGSMSGEPIAQAKRAIRKGLAHLEEDDTFQVIQFSNNASQLGPAPIPATRDNVKRGDQYVKALDSGGGTMMIKGIKAALDFPHDEDHYRYVCFMTDGYIGNEREILGAVRTGVGDSRIFSFGVGSSVNRYLMEGMARIGRGAVGYVALDQKVDPLMKQFYERISHPALTDIEIDWGGLEVTDVYPRSIPDLFVGRPVILAGRFNGDGDATIRIDGTAGDQRISLKLAVSVDDGSATHAGLPSVWARAKIADLFAEATWNENPDLANDIKQVALDYGLMSAYTAFVAVDSSTQTAGAHGTTVNVPVPVPQGVHYETTVTE